MTSAETTSNSCANEYSVVMDAFEPDGILSRVKLRYT